MLVNRFDATVGQSGTAVINAVSKSGSDQFHGNTYIFARDAKFNAPDFFTGKKPPFKNDQYGFTLGTATTATGNRTTGNTFGGFYVAASCVLEDNLATGNGNSIAGRAGFVFNGAGNRATNNHAVSNPIGFSIANGPNVLMGNTAMSGTTGFSVSSNTNTMLTGNIATGNTTNFTINAGNDSGAVITNPGIGFTTTNPAANYGN